VYDLCNKGLCPKLLEIGQFDKVVGEGIEEVKSNEKPTLAKFPIKMPKRITSWYGNNNMKIATKWGNKCSGELRGHYIKCKAY
jgi:hypothetical protein